VTIGAFDGIHSGHVKILKDVVILARGTGAKSTVVTFDPHPAMVIAPDESPLLITGPDEKAALIEEIGVDRLVVMEFNPELASMSADWFVEEVLIGKLCMMRLVIGYDFHFGKSRLGDAAYLERAGERMGFGVDIVPPVRFLGHPVSSTRIRTALVRGEVEAARDMLGRPYRICGKVVPGEGRGRGLEYPTANLEPDEPRKIVPADGVYAGVVEYAGGRAAGALYIGKRPTYGGRTRGIEVYVVDASAAPGYGSGLCVDIIGRVRQDRTFETSEALKGQIARDVDKVREIIGINP
jgi:riboflavin kinase/FMN adenylyltransferase